MSEYLVTNGTISSSNFKVFNDGTFEWNKIANINLSTPNTIFERNISGIPVREHVFNIPLELNISSITSVNVTPIYADVKHDHFLTSSGLVTFHLWKSTNLLNVFFITTIDNIDHPENMYVNISVNGTI